MDLLKEALDDAMAEGIGVQAYLTRSGEPPALDATLYETACGIHGAVTTLTSWNTRWLRSVGTEATWIGSALSEHLATSGALASTEHFACERRGDALCVVPATRDDLPRVERALAALLPSSRDTKQPRGPSTTRNRAAKTQVHEPIGGRPLVMSVVTSSHGQQTQKARRLGRRAASFSQFSRGPMKTRESCDSSRPHLPFRESPSALPF